MKKNKFKKNIPLDLSKIKTKKGKREFNSLKNSKELEKVEKIARKICIEKNIEFIRLEYKRLFGGNILSLYVDKIGGITLDDCASINKHFGDLLDIAWSESDSYRLEVSSPGVNIF